MVGLALFVYRRPDYTRKVIDSIKRNHFEKIYIFQDGLKDETERKNWEEVSELIKGIDFAETEIHISERNKGLANSIIDGMNYVFERHEVAIALEDDVVLSDGYKSLAEALFEKYAKNKSVISICGGGNGTIIPKEYPYDVYFCYRMSSVAFGTWKDRWEGFERNPKLLTDIYSDIEKKRLLDYAGNDIEKMLFDSLRMKNDTWATYWALYQINHLGVHVIPVHGYAVDIGRNGNGTNTKTKVVRYNINLDGKKKEKYNLPEDVIISEEILQDTKNLMDKADNKFQQYFDILCKWIKLYQRKRSVLEYFQDKNIPEIYIYGTGNLANFLYHDIFPDVEILGYIVENRKNEKYKGRRVYDMDNYEGIKDIPIIVTPSYDIAFIKHFFEKCIIENEIILIDDVVEYAINKKENH